MAAPDDSIEWGSLKILWICHFTDPEVQSVLQPWQKKAQFAPWITHTIPVFENKDDLELHIVSPHEYISGVKEYKKNGVHYHFFNPYIPIWGRHWPRFFKWDVWTGYVKNKRIVKRIVEDIKPDVIHLQGAENPYYSSTILQFFGRYPIVVNLQRPKFTEDPGEGKFSKAKFNLEAQILNTTQYASIRTKSMDIGIRDFNPKIKTYWVNYARAETPNENPEKIYDIVFFARINKIKGIEDLLDALAILKKRGNPYTACIIGSISDQYLSYLKQKARESDLTNLLIWKGHLATQNQVHLEALKARICVLPTHKDVIPGTIIESMQLGLPVVSYKAGSIPELNEKRENVLLSDIGDIEGLAKDIQRLLTDAELYKTMSQRGIECIKERYSNQNVLQQHLDCYREVIADFHREKHQNSNHQEHREASKTGKN